MARKNTAVRRGGLTGPTAKRRRRRGAPGQGRLEKREITAADISGCADAGDIPHGERRKFEQWLTSTLEFCWLADRHFFSNRTLASKKAASTRIFSLASKLQNEFGKADISAHLLGAALQRRVLGRTVSEARYQRLVKATSDRVQRVARHNAWLKEVLDHDLNHLDRRPESGDEERARKPASKPAVEHLTEMIIDFWQRPRGLGRRPPKAAAMADFTAAVFRLAGDRGASRATAIERLKAALRSRQ